MLSCFLSWQKIKNRGVGGLPPKKERKEKRPVNWGKLSRNKNVNQNIFLFQPFFFYFQGPPPLPFLCWQHKKDTWLIFFSMLFRHILILLFPYNKYQPSHSSTHHFPLHSPTHPLTIIPFFLKKYSTVVGNICQLVNRQKQKNKIQMPAINDLKCQSGHSMKKYHFFRRNCWLLEIARGMEGGGLNIARFENENWHWFSLGI